jgi:hypothetical protein
MCTDVDIDGGFKGLQPETQRVLVVLHKWAKGRAASVRAANRSHTAIGFVVPGSCPLPSRRPRDVQLHQRNAGGAPTCVDAWPPVTVNS